MTQKEQVEEMLKAGKGYDEIEDQTGSARSYIRSIAVGYRKGVVKTEETGETSGNVFPPVEKQPETSGMNFLNDKTPEPKTNGKTSVEYHKAWVKAAKYECGSCGATIGKSESFCPHCGKPLVWEGIE